MNRTERNSLYKLIENNYISFMPVLYKMYNQYPSEIIRMEVLRWHLNHSLKKMLEKNKSRNYRKKNRIELQEEIKRLKAEIERYKIEKELNNYV